MRVARSSVINQYRLSLLVVHINNLWIEQLGLQPISCLLSSQISRKAELRSRLAELQLQLSGPQQTLGIVGDGKKEKMKRQV